jgi:hypothetical protein
VKKNFPAILIIVFVTTGFATQCGSIRTAIDRHNDVSGKIDLGDTKEKVLSKILPTQEGLKVFPHHQKQPEKYMKDGVRVEIFYVRSGNNVDGLTTDDEFIPYVFNDDILVGIGWAILGGPSTQGQTRPVTNVDVQTTIINP